jgi:hypothetical protein
MIRSPRILPITRRFNLIDENRQPKVHVLSAGFMCTRLVLRAQALKVDFGLVLRRPIESTRLIWQVGISAVELGCSAQTHTSRSAFP